MAEITYDIKKKYSELDSWIAGLTPGTYNVEVDCTGVAADQFIGYSAGGYPSPFVAKLSKAWGKNIFFNLKFGFPDNVTNTESCFGTDRSAIKTINITSAKNVTNAREMFHLCKGLTSIDTSAFTKVTDASYMFSGCTELTSITGTEAFTNVIDAWGMFDGCTGLTSIDTSAFTKATNTSAMFMGCSRLTSINWGAIKPATNKDMFSGASAQKTIKVIGQSTVDWIKANETNMKLTNYTVEKLPWTGKLKYNELDIWMPELDPGTYDLEVDCTGEKYLSLGAKLSNAKSGVLFNLKPINVDPKITDAYSMFSNCTGLKSIDTTAFTKVTDAIRMFYNCTGLTSITGTKAFTHVTDASYMFYNCTGLKSIDTTAFTKVTDAIRMFSGCSGLTSIDTSGFTNIKDVSSMFSGCSGLTSIDTSGFTNIKDASQMFYGCSGLTSITGTEAFTKVTDAIGMFDSCTGLTSIDTSAFTKVTDANSMFYNCTGLTSIDTSGFTKVTDAIRMFDNCTNLSTLYATNSNVFDKGADLTASPIKTVYTNAATKEKIKSKLPSSGVVYYDLKEKLTYAVVPSSDTTAVNYNNKYVPGNLKVCGNVNGDTGQFNTINVKGGGASFDSLTVNGFTEINDPRPDEYEWVEF